MYSEDKKLDALMRRADETLNHVMRVVHALDLFDLEIGSEVEELVGDLLAELSLARAKNRALQFRIERLSPPQQPEQRVSVEYVDVAETNR